MTDHDDRDAGDSSMIELFRSDLAFHKPVLRSNLLALKDNPGAADRMEALCKALRTIRGAAGLIELDPVVKISQAMENCLNLARKRRSSLTPRCLDLFAAGIDLFEKLSEGADTENEALQPGSAQEIEDLVAAIESLSSEAADPAPTLSDSAPPPPFSNSPSSPPSFIDPAILGIFRSEAATNAQILSDGLLTLENEPDDIETLETVMRGAHSLKGAARIVGLDSAVKLAHTMEDCFVAAQKGEVLLAPRHIDVLLKGVDMLVKTSEAACGDSLEQWLVENRPRADALISSISAIRTEKGMTTGEGEIEPPASTPSGEPACAAPESRAEAHRPKAARKQTGELGRTVRVTAAKIDRLIGLAGEVAVSSRWLPTFSDSFLALKRDHVELSTILEIIQELSADGSENGHAQNGIRQARERLKKCGISLAERLNRLDLFINSSTTLSDRLYHEAVGIRMRPFLERVQSLPRMVRDLARQLGKKVKLEIAGASTEVDQDILEKLDAPINHLLRNAVDHGIDFPRERLAAGKPEIGVVSLQAEHRSGMLMITISDDGRGVDMDRLKKQILKKGLAGAELVERMSEAELLDFLFLPGFSTARKVTEISGRGVGLDVVHNMVHEVGGVVRATSRFGQGITFQLELPLTLSVIRMLLVEIAGEPYAFPLARIDRCLIVPREQIMKVEDRQYFRFDEKNTALVNIHHVLEIEEPADRQDDLTVVVVSDRMDAYGLVVDNLLGECDLVIRPLDPRLGKVPNISAAALMLDNSPVLIFDIEDLIRSIDNLLTGKRLRSVGDSPGAVAQRTHRRILVVDDSITVRELERKMLENAGYHVEVAVDGVDGWNAVRSGGYDMVVSDVDMPRMNGIELIGHIREHPDFKSLPVIVISYKDKEEDRLAGLQAGADYYLTKSSFQDDSFLEAVENLIGGA